jgi:hypothetical protein
MIALPTFVGTHPDFRGILLEDTAGPVNLYGPNAERGARRGILEIKRASNVSVFGTKTETTSWPGRKAPFQTPFAIVQQSSNILIGGFAGHSAILNGRSSPADAFQFVDSAPATAAVIHWNQKQLATASGAMLIENRGTQRLAIPGSQEVVLFRRD